MEEKLPRIPEEFQKPLDGETEQKWLRRMLSAKIDLDDALQIIDSYRSEQAAKIAREKYGRLDTADGFGPTGSRNPGETPDPMEE